MAAQAGSNYDQNGIISLGRRLSRAYDQPIVQHTSKGAFVRPDVDRSTPESSSSGVAESLARFEAIGGVMAKVTLGFLTVMGAVVSLLGRASLEPVSQLFGFMVMLSATFLACTGSFFWWGGTGGLKVGINVKKVLHIYTLCVSSDVLARLISIFTAMPPSSILGDTGYFVSLSTLLLFAFSLLIHGDGLNAMFSQETVLFVVFTMVLNFSSTCLFCDILPYFLLPHLVYAGLLLGLSLSLVGYRLPKLTPSAIYKALNQEPPPHIVTPKRVSGDNSRPVSRRESYSSTVSSVKPASISSSVNSFYPQGLDSEVASEVRGILTELLFHKDSLASETYQKLRRIKDILSPRTDRVSHTRVHVGSSIESDDRDYESVSDISSLTSSSRYGSHLVVKSPKRKHRSISVVQMRSTNYAATTTTDTGMPVLESGPVERARSQALRDVKARISIQEKRLSVHRMGRERLGSDGRIAPVVRERLNSEGRLTPRPLSRKDVSSLSNTSLTASMSEAELSGAESTGSLQTTQLEEGDGRQPVATPPPQQQRLVSKMGSSTDQEPGNLEIITEGAELEVDVARPRSATLPPLKHAPFKIGDDPDEDEDLSEAEKQKSDVEKRISDAEERLYDQKQLGDHKFYSFTRYKRPSESCDLSEYTSNEHLDMFENVAVWDYPIFELEENAGDHILSHMAHMLFHEAGLMETFQIPQREFINYFRALEANYGNNVYHNKTHAADVLHAVSYLMFEIIPQFSHEYADAQREWKGYSNTKGSGGNIASAFSILEVLACYMASAMHDFDHPGRTNAFLVGTRSPLAVLYNDRSVLENHHAAASWHLLTNFEQNNFLFTMDETELKRLRFLIIEAILATDLKMHFDILSTFRSKVNPEEGGGIDWSSEMDRMLVMKMIIKMADINTPTKSLELHRKWTERITEEFYQQSEEEEQLNLPHTIFMDRRHPEKLPAVQLSFIQHLVSPLFKACAEAGIIPGISEPAQSTPAPEEALEEGEEGEAGKPATNSSDIDIQSGEDAFTLESEEGGSNFMSILLTNLQVNYEAWKAELPEEETKEEANDTDAEKKDDKEEVDDEEMGIKEAVKEEEEGSDRDKKEVED